MFSVSLSLIFNIIIIIALDSLARFSCLVLSRLVHQQFVIVRGTAHPSFGIFPERPLTRINHPTSIAA